MEGARIRPLAICVFLREGSILVFEGYDPVKRQVFYRPLGGGIEFGEHSRDAVVREIREELGREITNLRSLGILENIFTYNGQTGHEIVVVYDGAFVDRSIYEQAQLTAWEDNGESFTAMWKPLQGFMSGQAPLYPDGLLNLLLNLGG